MDTSFYVGTCQVEPRLNRIVQNGQTVELEPKVMRVLLCLAREPGAVRTRDELLEEVWPGTVVTDHVLTRAISHLRQAFGDSPQQPRYIQTISKSGYRLIADVATGADALSGDGQSLPYLALPVQASERARGAGAPRGTAPRATVVHRRWPLALILGAAGALLAAALLWVGLHPPPVAQMATVVPVVSTPGLDYHPMLSPDGNLLVFSRPGEAGASDLFVRLIGTEREVRLTTHPGYDDYATWLPGGREVAFQRMHDGTCTLYAVPAMGGVERRLGPCGPHQHGLDASPDGRYFVVTDQVLPDAPRNLYLVDTRTFGREPLTQAPAGEMDLNPQFSPDGRHVAFLRGIRHAGITLIDLYVVALDGRQVPRRLTTDRGEIAGFTWTPDGRHLVFSSNRMGTYRLWKIPLGGGEPSYLAGVPTFDPAGPSMAREGGRLAFEEWNFDFNVWAYTPQTDTLSPLVTSTRWDHQPDVSPEGGRMAFLTNRRGEHEVWTARSDGTQARPLAEHAAASTPRWSPDGKLVAYSGHADARLAVFAVDAEGGTPRRLTAEGDAFYPSWSQDGRWIYYSTSSEGRWQVWKVPTEGGAAQQVTTGGGYVAREGPDGRLYYVHYYESGLWRLLPDGRSEKVVEDLHPGDWTNWDVTEEGIFYVARSAEGATLTHFDPATGHHEPLYTFSTARLGYLSGLSVAPDGRVLVSLVDEHESDIHLVDSLLI